MTFKIATSGDNDSADVRIGPFTAAVLPQQFHDLDDPQARKRLFSYAIRVVVVEVTSYCNRRCRFCPNVEGARLAGQAVLPQDAFRRMVDCLAEIAYAGKILWHLYNEPLAAPEVLLPRMRRARERLPHAAFSLNTNGDYLTASLLRELAESGCNDLFVSIYGPNHGDWHDDYIRERVIAAASDWGVPGRLTERAGSLYSVVGEAHGMTVRVVGRNLWKSGYDRGGLLPELRVERSSPCLAPFAEFLVDHRGYVLPCCNVYTDRADHLAHAIGNICEADIFEIYASRAAQQWRRGVLTFRPGGALCAGCSRGDVPEIDTAENRSQLGRLRSRMMQSWWTTRRTAMRQL